MLQKACIILVCCGDVAPGWRTLSPLRTVSMYSLINTSAYGTLCNVAIVLRWSSGAVRIRLKFRKCEVNWRVRWMVHIALRAIVFVCRGTLEFVCDALEFQNLPIGDSETLLHFVPISRLRAFAIDAKCVESMHLRRSICAPNNRLTVEFGAHWSRMHSK